MILSYFLEQNFVLMFNLNLITLVLVLNVDFAIQVEQNALCVQRETIKKILAINVRTCMLSSRPCSQSLRLTHLLISPLKGRKTLINCGRILIEDTKSGLDDYRSHLARQVFEDRYDEEEIKTFRMILFGSQAIGNTKYLSVTTERTW